MLKIKKAFTLTELLIALVIIGAVAALTIPSLVSSVNQKIFESKKENMKLQFQQLAMDQMVHNKTKTIEDTDFSNPADLVSSNKSNLDVSSRCTISEDTECWDPAYRDQEKNDVKIKMPTEGTVLTLKNGAMIIYTYDSKNIEGSFLVDLNGKDLPNIIGQDLYVFNVDKYGKVFDSNVTLKSDDEDDDQNKNNCEEGDDDCEENGDNG